MTDDTAPPLRAEPATRGAASPHRCRVPGEAATATRDRCDRHRARRHRSGGERGGPSLRHEGRDGRERGQRHGDLSTPGSEAAT